MNKEDLVTYMAENSEGKLTKRQSDQAIDLLLNGIVHGLENGEKVQLVGNMTIQPVGRKARKGNNPQTGEKIDIPAKMLVKIKPGKRFERAVENLNVDDFLKK